MKNAKTYFMTRIPRRWLRSATVCMIKSMLWLKSVVVLKDLLLALIEPITLPNDIVQSAVNEMADMDRIEALEARVVELENALYENMKISNQQWTTQAKINQGNNDAAKALLDVRQSLLNMVTACNNDMDDVWFVLDQLITQFKLDTKNNKVK